jgi:hypothetical protein
MRIGIYHPFGDFPDNYSLSSVVKEQILMICENGHDCHFFTAKNFKYEFPQWFTDIVGEKLTIHAVLPRRNVKAIKASLKDIIEEMDAVLTHDVAYLGVYEDHAKSIEYYIEQCPHIKWFHWAHSAPNIKDKKEPLGNSIYIGMNYSDLQLLAQQFQVPVAKCQVIYNPVSPDVFLGLSDFTRNLISKYDLLKYDVLITYPFDTGRLEDKGVMKIIELVKAFNRTVFEPEDWNAKAIFVNAAANDVKRREKVEKLAEQFKKEAIFTSIEEPNYSQYVPRHIVEELFSISNVFPLLSISEGCSLIMLEAAMKGNLIVLNEDFPPMQEFGELDYALYMKVSSTRRNTTYNPNFASYCNDWARTIRDTIINGKALNFKRKVLKRFNRQWIWENQLAPLLGL